MLPRQKVAWYLLDQWRPPTMFRKMSRDRLLSKDKCRLYSRPWNASPSKTRFWKNNYARRQYTVFRKKTRKVPVLSDETERDRRVVTPQVDRSDKMQASHPSRI